MDDIFDSLIYIIITIVAFAISAISRKKKKQSSNPRSVNQPIQEEKRKDSLLPNIERLLREEMGLENKEVYNNYDQYEVEEEEVLDSTENILDTVPPEMLDDKPDVPYSIEYDDSDTISVSSIQDSDITLEESEISNVIDEFDIQKAVIYSEIINRKEY